ncbi:MAG: hypothetical protein ACTS22_08770 [Phycisphaerales bacterium]
MDRTTTTVRLTAAGLATLVAGWGCGQTCALLDINGTGVINDAQLDSMIQTVVAGVPNGLGRGDLNSDGAIDGVDLAFFVANFAGCAADSSVTTRTSLPEPGDASIVVRDVTTPEQLATAGVRMFEVLVALDDPADEVISVTHGLLTTATGAPVGVQFFEDTAAVCGAANQALPLSAACVDAEGVIFDTHLAIGDRTGELAPVQPFAPVLDLPAYESRDSIEAPLGWFGDVQNSGSSGVSGAGGAEGNVDNEVLVLTVACVFDARLELSVAVATADGRLRITETVRRLTNRCRADTNLEGIVNPNDFTAWVQSYFAQSYVCDQNGDDACAPDDFIGWIVNYNNGC